MYIWSVIHGIKRKPHLSVVWNWYHFVAIAILHQPSPYKYAIATQWYQFHTTDAWRFSLIINDFENLFTEKKSDVLQWRYNERDGVSNHQPHDCLLNRAYQRKHQSSVPLTFVCGIHRSPMNSPYKWPVKRKMFTFDDVIMGLPKPLGSPRAGESIKRYGCDMGIFIRFNSTNNSKLSKTKATTTLSGSSGWH